MAHWQAMDGTRSSVLAMNQLANILRRAIAERHPFPGSILGMDWDAASALQGWFYVTRWGRLPPADARGRLRVIFRFARLALLARCSDGPWWTLDDWHPRCDPRIPLAQREPQANYGCSPGQISQPWLREAVKWHLGTMLESGALRWSTVSQERLKCLPASTGGSPSVPGDPRDVLGDPAAAAGAGRRVRPVGRRPGCPLRQQPAPRQDRGRPADQRRPARRRRPVRVRGGQPGRGPPRAGPVAVGRRHRGARGELVPAGDPDPAPARPDGRPLRR